MQVTLDGLLEVTRGIEGFSERRTRYVMAEGLTRSAIKTAREWEGELFARLDRPMAQTLRSVNWKKATINDPTAEVYIREGAGAPINWLAPNEYGGKRDIKQFERSLQSAGAMPQGWRAVPTQATKLNQYGNISKSLLIAVIRDCARSGATPGYRQAIGRKSAPATTQYFAVPAQRGGLKPGVYRRLKRGAPEPVLLFKPAVTYRRMLGLNETAGKIAPELVQRETEKVLEEHIKKVWGMRNGR